MSVNPFYDQIGILVREARERAGMTQSVLAEQVGLSRTSITNIERGNQGVALDLWLRLADVLEVEPMELLPARHHLQAQRPLNGLRREESRWVRSIIEEEQ